MGTSYETGYYVSTGTETRRVLYGPYATAAAAFDGAYFRRPVSERDRHVCYGRGARMLRNFCYYEAEEIRLMVEEPEGLGYTSVTVRGTRPWIHPSWRGFDADLRAKLLREDRSRALGEVDEVV